VWAGYNDRREINVVLVMKDGAVFKQ